MSNITAMQLPSYNACFKTNNYQKAKVDMTDTDLHLSIAYFSGIA